MVSLFLQKALALASEDSCSDPPTTQLWESHLLSLGLSCLSHKDLRGLPGTHERMCTQRPLGTLYDTDMKRMILTEDTHNATCLDPQNKPWSW